MIFHQFSMKINENQWKSMKINENSWKTGEKIMSNVFVFPTNWFLRVIWHVEFISHGFERFEDGKFNFLATFGLQQLEKNSSYKWPISEKSAGKMPIFLIKVRFCAQIFPECSTLEYFNVVNSQDDCSTL
jgi:hypothetical protein